MSVKILHLFHDLMNMYGDYGNVTMLRKSLEGMGLEVEVSERSAGDILFDKKYDFIYCGAGTERKRNKALEVMRPEADKLRDAIESGVQVLFTGNSWETLGHSILTVDGDKLPGLGIFSYETAEDPDKRITGDIIAYADFSEQPVCGFINKCGSTTDVESPLFGRITLGPGNTEVSGTEGFHYKNFCGTEIIGPLLVKNPHFMTYILKSLAGSAYKDTIPESAKKAYEVTLNALSERIN